MEVVGRTCRARSGLRLFAAQVKENIIHIDNKPKIIAIFKFPTFDFSGVLLKLWYCEGCHGKQYQEILSDYLQISNLNIPECSTGFTSRKQGMEGDIQKVHIAPRNLSADLFKGDSMCCGILIAY